MQQLSSEVAFKIKFESHKQLCAGVIAFGNTAASALIFTLAISNENLRIPLVIGSFFVLIASYLFAIFIMRRVKA